MKGNIPLWLKISYTIMVLVIIPVYWRDLGPANFLWFSDIALFSLVAALWFENRLINSTMAVAVFFLESAWVLDFLTGGNLIQISAYMFDPDTAMHIRIISGLFHITLPPVLLYLLVKLGYDKRALLLQTIIALMVLPVTYWVTEPGNNVNWVYGPAGQQNVLPDYLYLVILATVLIVFLYIPSHLLFKRLFSHKKCFASTSE